MRNQTVEPWRRLSGKELNPSLNFRHSFGLEQRWFLIPPGRRPFGGRAAVGPDSLPRQLTTATPLIEPRWQQRTPQCAVVVIFSRPAWQLVLGGPHAVAIIRLLVIGFVGHLTRKRGHQLLPSVF